MSASSDWTPVDDQPRQSVRGGDEAELRALIDRELDLGAFDPEPSTHDR